MIGVDWGTSNFRALRMDDEGRVFDRRAVPRGIMHVENGDFEAVLREQIGAWLAEGESRVLLSGMIGSRQGWVEAPYLPCPAGAADIAAALTHVAFAGATVKLVPGLSDIDEAGVPEVMRGEETQIIGVLDSLDDGLVCHPGSHAKWVRIAGGRIEGFRTYLSGEGFSALRDGTILGRMMQDGPTDMAAFDRAAFDRGVARSGQAGHLLHHLFGVRTLALFGRLAPDEGASYLSGLLIGHEVRAALPAAGRVQLIGAAPLCAQYARAIAACGGTAQIETRDAAVNGLARIGKSVAWHQP
jgi:2-dehydro-3-deoxygalactonokinase